MRERMQGLGQELSVAAAVALKTTPVPILPDSSTQGKSSQPRPRPFTQLLSAHVMLSTGSFIFQPSHSALPERFHHND